MQVVCRWIAGPLLLFCIYISAACGEESPTTTKEKVSTLIAQELAVGAPPSEIEAFFNRHGFKFSYNHFRNHYQALTRISDSHAIRMLIFLDAEKNFVRADVHDSFTGL